MNQYIVFLYIVSLAQSVLIVDPVNGSDEGTGPFRTIQGAIAINSGSVLDIELRPGIYELNSTIVFSNSLSVVRLIATDPQNTHFQCSDPGYKALSFPGISSVELYGITISDCYDTISTSGGGALWANMVLSIKISSCQFYNNTGRKGGAVSIQSTSNPASLLTIVDTIFTYNNASNGGGGGLFITMFDTFISNCTFNYNNATAGGGGINIYWEGTGGFPFNITISNSTIQGNQASTSGAGISSFNLVPQASLFLINTTITQNTLFTSASCQGVGIYFYAGSLLQIKNSWITENIGVNPGSVHCQGGGIYTAWFNGIGSLQLYSTEVSSNYAYLTGGVMITTRTGKHMTDHYIVNSVFRNNTGSNSYGALFTSNCSVIIDHSLFEMNNGPTNLVAQDGGAINLRSSIVRNHSTIAVSCENSKFIFYESSIYNNFQDFNCVATCDIQGTTETLCSACSTRDLCSKCNGNNTLSCAAQCDSYTWYSRADECPGVIPTITMTSSSVSTISSTISTSSSSSTIGDTTMTTTYGTTSATGTTTNEVSTLETSSTTRNSYSNIKTSSGNSSTTVIAVGVGIGGGIFIIVISVLVFLLLMKRKASKNNQDVPMKTIAKATEIKDIVIGRCIGKGNYSEVFEGVWQGTTKVAVKLLKSQGEMKEFMQEAELLHSLNHPNILRFLGIFYSDAKQYIVTELMHESLLVYLVQYKLGTKDYNRIAQQVAAGMRYLESCKIVHRDLACRNLLVSSDENPSIKIADLGLARTAEKEMYKSKGAAIAIKWSAPEVYKHGISTSLSDVWSFGVVLWEIYSGGKIPYTSFSNEEVIEKVDSGYRLPPPPGMPLGVQELMARCWNEVQENRPNFKDIYEQLCTMTGEEKNPKNINPINFETISYQ